jgi:hypothetical protein
MQYSFGPKLKAKALHATDQASLLVPRLDQRPEMRSISQ